MPPVHIENGQNAKNDLKPTNAKNDLKPTNAKNDLKPTNAKNDLKLTNAKNANENEKNISGPHASVYFENGPNVKNAHENEKMYNRTTCLCVFRKWAEYQKRLKTTELNKKFHN